MKIAVRYYTKTGNSQKLAEAIAAELGVTAKPVSVPLDDPVDKLVLCNTMYLTDVDKHVGRFIKENASKMGELVNVSNGSFIVSSYGRIKQIAAQYGVKVSQREFHCLGQTEVSYQDHPSKRDLQNAREFIRSVAA